MDNYYSYNEEKIQSIKSNKLWINDPKYFKRVKISPSAIIKMMSHSQSGVDKGIKQSGKPLEVMGLLFGHPDVDDLNCIIVTDAHPIPAEGFETKVVIDDQSVINHMIDLGEVTEEISKYSYCGWYHTHPFDLDGTSHCYLSSTDMNTQRQWQRAEDPHGNPWLAIVIDPLRSIAKGSPELMAFRAYPVEYEPPQYETPDGTIIKEELRAVEKWGVCWRGYYKLETSYFMSTLASNTLTILKNKFLWMNAFTQQPLEDDTQQEINNRIDSATSSIKSFHSSGFSGVRQSSLYISNPPSTNSSSETQTQLTSVINESSKESSLTSHSQDGCKVCSDLSQRCMLAMTRNIIFGRGLNVSDDDHNDNSESINKNNISSNNQNGNGSDNDNEMKN